MSLRNEAFKHLSDQILITNYKAKPKMHPRLEKLMSDKALSDLSYEDLMEKVRQIRQGRVTPTKKKVSRKKSTTRVRKNRANNLLDSLSPAEKAKLLEKLGENQ